MKLPHEDRVMALARRLGVENALPLQQRAPAVLLRVDDRDSTIGQSRLGGLPDLPVGTAWPRWDATRYIEEKLGFYRAHPMADAWKDRIQKHEELLTSPVTPLGFLAQLNLQDLSGQPHGLHLPSEGHLFFFWSLVHKPWGFSPNDAGSWAVLHAPPGAELEPATPPADLDREHVLSQGAIDPEPLLTIPSEVDGHEWTDAWEEFEEELNELGIYDAPRHQVGGEPQQIQGDMREACSLVSKGIYLGHDPGLSEEEEARLTADSAEWKLLLQLASDDDLGWMWGDLGNLYFWMKEGDIAGGNWDRAWFQMQCS